MLTTLRHLAAVATAGLWLAATASAQHAHDSHNIEVGSDADGSGSLVMDWDFDAKPIARVVDAGFAGLFTGDVPGFGEAADGDGIFQLEIGTQVEVEVLSIDTGLSLDVEGTLLDEAGDVAVIGTTTPDLHAHPDYQLFLSGADANTFGEGRVTFRVREGSSSFGYGTSETRTLTVSNGYLPVLEAPSEEELACQKAVAKIGTGYAKKVDAYLVKCFDKLFAAEFNGKSEAAALKACDLDANNSKGLVGYLAAVKTKAVEGIAKKCGPLSGTSVPYTESMIHAHLGMTSCRIQELVGARYNGASGILGHLLEHEGLGDTHDVLAALPCLKASHE